MAPFVATAALQDRSDERTDMRTRSTVVLLCVCLLAMASNAAAADDSAHIAGIVYAAGDAPKKLPGGARDVVLCFDMVKIDSTTQPILLQPASQPETYCATESARARMLVGSRLVVRIASRDEQGHPTEMPAVTAIGIQVDSQAGSALDPAPIRPSPAAAQANAAKASPQPLPHEVFLTWPVALGGDTIPAVTVFAQYRDGATDTLLTLLKLTLPQVHTLYYYNAGTGVV